MKKFYALVASILVTLFAALPASAAPYYGWNPATGLETTHGALVDGGAPPVITGTCGTIGAVTAGAVNGKVVAGAVTTCTLIVTFAGAAPNGWVCLFTDLTTPADTVRQASSTTTSCTTSASTIVASDVIAFSAFGY
jgi:hypothetical protein